MRSTVPIVCLTDALQEAFKAIVDKFTPKSWKEACLSNPTKPAIPVEIEQAGY